MGMQAGLALTAALVLAGCSPQPGDSRKPATAETALYHASELGVAFARDDGLDARSCEYGGPRCIAVFNPAAEAHRRELYTVQTFDGPLETVAAAEAGFERDDQGRLMTTYGRFEPVAVEPFRAGDLEGLRAVVTCGISDPDTGFHAAAGECLWAVVSDGDRSAVIASTGYADGLEAAEVAARSLVFHP